MPVATTTSASSLLPTMSKMEDRKRPALSSADDLAPPSKRLAVNGSKTKDDGPEMKEESWVDAYTKGAIYRQMQEYSRKAATAESRLEELHKRSVHHDDHLRIIDAWWLQLLEELESLTETKISDLAPAKGSPYLTGVTFKDLQEFQQHLQDKGKSIIARAEKHITRLAAHRGEVTPKSTELEEQINTLLVVKKEFMLKLDRLSSEKDQLSEQLNAATLRYFKAEKKLDRVKSVQVQKLEQQAFTRVTQPAAATGSNAEPETKNGSVDNTEMIAKYEEATAAASKQKEQLEKFLAEIRTLQEENSTLKARKETWTDEDFIRTDVFKQFKSQNEDLIRRINNLEATNKQLREDAEKLQMERMNFKTQLEADANQITQELEAEIISRDQDLARVRSARDEILAENTQRKASMEQEKLAIEQIKELVAARDDRITSLESQISRLESSGDANTTTTDDSDSLSQEELHQKYKKLLLDFQSINQELPSIERAYKKMKDLAQKKVMDFTALEDRVSVLIAEKSKADQKYFAARKDADTRNSEIRALRLQNAKSAEIIAQLKDLESQSRATLSNLEKQLADLKQTNASLATENKKVETNSHDTLRRTDTLNKQINDLTSLVKSKDSATAMIKERNTVQETEVEKLKVRIENAQKDRDYWKSKALSNHSVEEEGLRRFAVCSICEKNFKNRILKTCGHLFCKNCIEDRISNRMRKCPSCAKSFDKMDVMQAHHQHD